MASDDRVPAGAPSGWLTPRRIAAIYLVLSATWILASDWFLASLPIDRTLTTGLQTVKGWLFVAASTVLLYVLVARSRQQLESANNRLRRALQQTSVLHRVLRHNLRNACTVIELEAERLAGKTDEEGERADLAIDRKIDELLGLSEKCRHLRHIALGEQERKPIDLVAIVEDTATTVRECYPAATITVDAPGTARAQAYPEIEFAVQELAENAVEHNGETGEPHETPMGVSGDETDDSANAGPTVRIEVRETDAGVTVAVADDGPGLPEMERTVIEQDMEEPLSHSSGLGLWIVRAIVLESGGSLHLAESTDETTVEIDLPAAGRDQQTRVPIARQTV